MCVYIHSQAAKIDKSIIVMENNTSSVDKRKK